MTKRAITRILLGLALVLFLGIGGIRRARTITNPGRWGETMGTSYSIKLIGKVKKSDLNELTGRIDTELIKINKQMSTWDPDSEISRFNHARTADPISISGDFAQVVTRALEFSETSGGAFDPTLQPLLNLWGFGSEATETNLPSKEAVAAAKSKTGWQKITVIPPASLRKSEPEISLALGAIAKGYGVDALSRLLEEAGYDNWFVEIGGEVAVNGLNADGVPWKIGIQYPSTSLSDDALQGILNITNGAVATSGDYRNYIMVDGTLYSHILDPRTGRTVLSDTASVSVYTSNCTDADAIATALFVMGADDGLAWVEQMDGVEAMFLLRDETGAITERFSSGFETATGYITANGAKHP